MIGRRFSNSRQLEVIKSRKEIDLTVGMHDSKGNLVTNRKSIAEIFATFYEELYRSRQDDKHDQSEGIEIPAGTHPFNENQLIQTLKSMKSGKAPDQKGLVVEMLKSGNTKLRSSLLAAI